MGWTAPRTYVTNEIVTATILNTDHRDNLIAVTDAVLVRRTTTQSTQPFDVSFDTEVFDDAAFWAGGSPTRITLTSAGRYEFKYWGVPTGGSDGGWQMFVRRYNSGAALQEDNIGASDQGFTKPGSGAGVVVASAGDFLILRYTAGASGTTPNLATASFYVRKAKA